MKTSAAQEGKCEVKSPCESRDPPITVRSYLVKLEGLVRWNCEFVSF